MLPVPNSPAAEVFLEKEEDAVFAVRLRRVTYNSGLTDSFLQWQTEKVRTLRAATEERLIVELLPVDGEIDPTFLITFLGTYRTFMTAEKLLAMIRERVSSHCNLHSLTTISRSSSEASIGSASTERSQSGRSVSSSEDVIVEDDDVLCSELPSVMSSTEVTFDDDDMVGTEELARSVMGRSFSMSMVGNAGCTSPSLSGRPSVSQRVKMFSMMSQRNHAEMQPRPVIRSRAATVHGRRVDSDMGSSCESHHTPLPPHNSTETHTRQGSDGTQRDSGNGTESQEEGCVTDADQRKLSGGVRRRLQFSKGETSADGGDQTTESDRSLRGDELCASLRPMSSMGFSRNQNVEIGHVPRSKSFSPQLVTPQAYTKPSSRFLRPSSPKSPSRSSPISDRNDSPSPMVMVSSPSMPSQCDLESCGSELESSMIDEIPEIATVSDGDQPLTATSIDDVEADAVEPTRTLTTLDQQGRDNDPNEDDADVSKEHGDEEQLDELHVERRADGPDPKDIFKSVLSVLRVWLDQYPEDFRTPQLQMHLFGLLEECRISPGQEFDDVYSLAEVLSAESSPTGGSMSGPNTPAHHQSIKKSSTLVNLHQRHRNTLQSRGALGVDVATMPRSYLDFLSIPAMKLAEQLTLIDAGLFRKVVPYHCLSHFWSRRNSDKPGVEKCASVTATIDQFNRVCMLLSTSLMKGLKHKRVSAAKENKPPQRAKIIQHWVDIAQCCRILKNFSSLRAIISQLQSASINRMSKTWSLVDKDALLLFKELCQMSSFSDNDQKTRAILMKEGTSKYSGFNRARTAKSPRGKANRYSDSLLGNSFIVQGVVPYLGTFLTDLTMVDTAHPNRTEEGWINFQKRRKEFELLAQLTLFQKACNYEFPNDTMVQSWMLQSEVITEDECYQCSVDLEPEPAEHRFLKPSGGSTSWKSRFKRTINISTKPKKREDPPVVFVKREQTTAMPAPGVSNRLFRGSMRGDARQHEGEGTTNGDLQSSGRSHTGSMSSQGDDKPSWDAWFKDGHLIRVRMETDQTSGAYKSFLLNNGDRARAVIERVLEKNLISERAESFSLYQVTPPAKEVRIPMDANVFYAINTNCEKFDFVLRHADQGSARASPCSSFPPTPTSSWKPLAE